DFLTAVQNGSIDNNWGNPGPDDNVQPDQINFSLMAPGTIFTMAGEQYRYLENQGGGNHMIIRNEAGVQVSWDNQDSRLNQWYDTLDPSVQAMVQPVENTFTVGSIAFDDVTFEGTGWIPLHLTGEVGADNSAVDLSGTSRAFSLSLADVARLSGPGLAWESREERRTGEMRTWWLRTPGESGRGWRLTTGGTLQTFDSNASIRIRPALIVHQ
ncbi:hypothetical protein AALA52_09925, partial [Lactococcus ileimucosae]